MSKNGNNTIYSYKETNSNNTEKGYSQANLLWRKKTVYCVKLGQLDEEKNHNMNNKNESIITGPT